MYYVCGDRGDNRGTKEAVCLTRSTVHSSLWDCTRNGTTVPLFSGKKKILKGRKEKQMPAVMVVESEKGLIRCSDTVLENITCREKKTIVVEE